MRNVELPGDLIYQLPLALHNGLATRLLCEVAARFAALALVEIVLLRLVSHIHGNHIVARNRVTDYRNTSRADSGITDFALLAVTMDQVHDFAVLTGTRDCRSLSYTNDQSTVQYISAHPNNDHFQRILYWTSHTSQTGKLQKSSCKIRRYALADRQQTALSN